MVILIDTDAALAEYLYLTHTDMHGTAAAIFHTLLQEGLAMQRLTRLMGLGILGLALVVGTGFSGDTKKDGDKKEKAPNLPPGWKALMLSKDQLAKVHGIMGDYKGKIVVLQRKIDDLKSAEKSDMIKVLTDEQKALYLKNLTGDDGKDKGGKDKDKDK
jgi:hypothetical protein